MAHADGATVGVIMKVFSSIALVCSVVFLTGCAPEVGSDAWCSATKEKPKGDWTLDETRDYAKHCLF